MEAGYGDSIQLTKQPKALFAQGHIEALLREAQERMSETGSLRRVAKPMRFD
jgi:hypothetical protein